jgi:hypothetical protein
MYISDSADLETASNLCGKTSLSSGEDNIEKLSSIWHRGDIFPGSLHVGRLFVCFCLLVNVNIPSRLASPQRKKFESNIFALGLKSPIRES